MKIIIIGTAYPYRGGLAAYNERLANEFLAQGHEVEIVTFTLQYPSFLFPGNTQFTKEKKKNSLKITRMINSINPANWLRVAKYVKSQSPDRIIFCYWMAFMAPSFGTIAKMAKSSKSKCIGLIHNMIPHESSILDKILPYHFVKQMDGFIAMSDSVVKDIEFFDKKNKVKAVSPHPIYDHYGSLLPREEALKKLNLNDKVFHVLFFGFIRQYKGLDLLIKAFADPRIKNLPVNLIIAGEFYENPDPYLSDIMKLGLERKVELRTTFIPDKEVKYYFSAADLVAQPYKDATQSGVSQIAYHFNRPMLVTNVGGLAETVPDGKVGYVVDVDVQKIADAIYDFFVNNRAEQMQENILEEKKRFAWSCMTDKIIELLPQS